MKSNFEKGKRIESLDELYSCEFIIFDYGGFYKVYHNGWFNSWQVRNCINLINNGCLFKAEKVEKSSVLVLGYDGLKDSEGHVYYESCWNSDNGIDFVFIDKEYSDCCLTNIKHYKEFKTKDYVDTLNLGIKLANNGISKVCLDKKGVVD